jgi:hypothetical protein
MLKCRRSQKQKAVRGKAESRKQKAEMGLRDCTEKQKFGKQKAAKGKAEMWKAES